MLSKELTDNLINDQSFGFLLVRQKEHILTLIDNRRYDEARAALTTVYELWTLCQYTYKYVELIERIRQRDKTNLFKVKPLKETND